MRDEVKMTNEEGLTIELSKDGSKIYKVTIDGREGETVVTDFTVEADSRDAERKLLPPEGSVVLGCPEHGLEYTRVSRGFVGYDWTRVKSLDHGPKDDPDDEPTLILDGDTTESEYTHCEYEMWGCTLCSWTKPFIYDGLNSVEWD